ncbi:MAG TPA: exodeoxyribonuclease VII small subunit [Alphaproteobacteria bacterium]|jgi:exodeoxyribonuclease VII small subunit
MADTSIPPDIVAMSFEAALAELEGIVKQLEKGEGSLENAINAYQRGAALKRHCEIKLREAQERVEKIVVGPDGSIGAKPASSD